MSATTMSETKDKLSPISIILHWTIAVGMLTLLSVGWYMESFEVYGLYDIHKSSGILLFVVIFSRVIWRLKQGWPQPLTQTQKIEFLLGKLTHWGLLISTLLFPISGMMMSAMGGHGLDVFGLELLSANVNAETGRSVPINKDLASLGREMHGILLWVVLGLVSLHLAGALKHHFGYKDGTLLRMLGR
ncbi:cytochrome b [Pleionea sp. CnH1-48]|uniref:cytochrome b n=1 Tax=Pleionea sp. CnH1-48 TaxID=2954494 RepID=UPI0020984A84|nr:cytochrome b [Pleionea sp. CnH1-48]MCO7224396.1 cytochrome b [Pleionea sp. CnH1-48]